MDEERGRVDEWLSVKDKNYSWTLSVTSDGRVLLSGRAPSRLDIYGPDALLLHTVLLPTSVGWLCHAVETPSRDFVIFSQKRKREMKVLLMNKDGGVMRSFSVASDSCTHVAVDREDRVFVADKFNYQLLLIDSTLSTSRVVLSRDKDRGVSPWRFYYSDRTGRLIVGHVSGRVDVFSVDS